MNNNVGLKIITDKVSVNLNKIVKKYREGSIGEIKEDILKGYLFAVLSSKIGNNLISLFTTGSVIPQIEAHHLELVPIPLFNKDIMERIDNKVSSYISKIEVAKENERKAIRMVEEEIEKWNN